MHAQWLNMRSAMAQSAMRLEGWLEKLEYSSWSTMLGYATVNWQGNCSEKRIAMGQQRQNPGENCNWSAASLKNNSPALVSSFHTT